MKKNSPPTHLSKGPSLEGIFYFLCHINLRDVLLRHSSPLHPRHMPPTRCSCLLQIITCPSHLSSTTEEVPALVLVQSLPQPRVCPHCSSALCSPSNSLIQKGFGFIFVQSKGPLKVSSPPQKCYLPPETLSEIERCCKVSKKLEFCCRQSPLPI